MARLSVGLFLCLLGCAAAGDESTTQAPSGRSIDARDPEPPSGNGTTEEVSSKALPDWPFSSRHEQVGWARKLGTDLKSSWFVRTRIGCWASAMASLGVRLDECGLWEQAMYGNSPLPVGAGPYYQINDYNVTSDGWRANSPFILPEKPEKWERFEANDEEGVWIPAAEPDVVCIGPDGWTRSVERDAPFDKCFVLVSTGRGRLYVVQMAPAGLMQVVPQSFDDEVERQVRAEWCFRDRDAFASRLDSLGKELAEAPTDADALNRWNAATVKLGFWVASPSEDEHAAANEPGGPSYVSEARAAGLRIGPTAGLAFGRDGVWSAAPPEVLLGSVLLVAPGNGRLLTFELGGEGRVIVAPLD